MDSITLKHDSERFAALSRIMSRWAASAHHSNVTQWLHSPAGKRYDSHGGYLVAERGIGYARLSFDDGRTDLTIYSPAPLA